MTNPAIDIATLLNNEGIGILGTNLFATKDVPPKPDLIIFMSTSGATDPDEAHLDYSYPTVQIIVRGAPGGYALCSSKMHEVNSYLHGLTSVKVNGMKYAYIFNSFGPIDLELDENRRPLMATTFKMLRSTNSLYLTAASHQKAVCYGEIDT